MRFDALFAKILRVAAVLRVVRSHEAASIRSGAARRLRPRRGEDVSEIGKHDPSSIQNQAMVSLRTLRVR